MRDINTGVWRRFAVNEEEISLDEYVCSLGDDTVGCEESVVTCYEMLETLAQACIENVSIALHDQYVFLCEQYKYADGRTPILWSFGCAVDRVALGFSKTFTNFDRAVFFATVYGENDANAKGSRKSESSSENSEQKHQ